MLQNTTTFTTKRRC